MNNDGFDGIDWNFGVTFDNHLARTQLSVVYERFTEFEKEKKKKVPPAKARTTNSPPQVHRQATHGLGVLGVLDDDDEQPADGAADKARIKPSWTKAQLDTTFGVRQYKGEENELVRDEDYGLFGLLARHCEVPQETWEAHNDYVQKLELKARQAKAPYSGKRAQRALARLSIFFLPIVPPYSSFSIAWAFFMLVVDVIYTAFWVPVNVAFCTTNFGQDSAGCTVPDLLGGAIYTVNLLLNFQMGVVIQWGHLKREVFDGPLIARYYMLYGRFWVDFLASIPFFYQVVIRAGNWRLSNSDSWLILLSLLRLVRLLRLISISKVIYADTVSGRAKDRLERVASVTAVYICLLIYLVSVVVNFEACILVLLAYLEGPENSWMSTITWTDLATANPAYQWYCALYWVVVTTTTTGFGDFAPRNVQEQVVSNLFMVTGMVMFGMLVGTISQALTRATAKAAMLYQYRTKSATVSRWLESRHVPDATRKQVQRYFAEMYIKRSEVALTENQIFQELPTFLRNKIAAYITMEMVRKVHLMEAFEPELQELVAQHLRPFDVPAGQDLCRQGAPANCLWILQTGSVGALQFKADARILDGPCLLGESVLLGPEVPACRLRLWTLRTVAPCKLWELKDSDISRIMRLYPGLSIGVLLYVKRMLLDELRSTHLLPVERRWGELTAYIMRAMRNQEQGIIEEAIAELKKASFKDRSLQAIMAGLIEFSTIKVLGPNQQQEEQEFSPDDMRASTIMRTLSLQRATSLGGHGGGQPGLGRANSSSHSQGLLPGRAGKARGNPSLARMSLSGGMVKSMFADTATGGSGGGAAGGDTSEGITSTVNKVAAASIAAAAARARGTAAPPPGKALLRASMPAFSTLQSAQSGGSVGSPYAPPPTPSAPQMPGLLAPVSSLDPPGSGHSTKAPAGAPGSSSPGQPPSSVLHISPPSRASSAALPGAPPPTPKALAHPHAICAGCQCAKCPYCGQAVPGEGPTTLPAAAPHATNGRWHNQHDGLVGTTPIQEQSSGVINYGPLNPPVHLRHEAQRQGQGHGASGSGSTAVTGDRGSSGGAARSLATGSGGHGGHHHEGAVGLGPVQEMDEEPEEGGR